MAVYMPSNTASTQDDSPKAIQESLVSKTSPRTITTIDFHAPESAERQQMVLCVDVGATNVKAANLPKMITMSQLKEIRTITFSSKNWLNQRLPMLFKNDEQCPLSCNLQIPPSSISLAITGPVIGNRTYFDARKRGIPENLKETCEQQANCEVFIENDAVCWAKGCLEYLRLKSQKLQFPSVGITLGTGVGVVLMQDEKTLCNVEISFIDCPFENLRSCIGGQPMEGCKEGEISVHQSLGEKFFSWTFNRQPFSDEQMGPHLGTYNERFQAFIKDLKGYIQKTFSLDITSVFVGGGNSRFIVASNDQQSLQLTVFDPHKLEAEHVSADILQLLGCLSSSQVQYEKSSFYPSIEEMERIASTWT